MVEQAAVPPGTQSVEPGPGPLPRRILPGADRERRQPAQKPVLGGDAGEAADRSAEPEPARVKGHDVVPFPQRRRNGREPRHERLDLLHRTAQVDEHRAQPPRRTSSRPVPDQRQADLAATGTPVVERHPRGRALKAAVARVPGQLRYRRRVLPRGQISKAAGAADAVPMVVGPMAATRPVAVTAIRIHFMVTYRRQRHGERTSPGWPISGHLPPAPSAARPTSRGVGWGAWTRRT